MELGEFVRRARASRLSKKSRFDDAAICVCSMPVMHWPHHQQLGLPNGGRLIGPFSHSPDKTKHLVRKKPDRRDGIDGRQPYEKLTPEGGAQETVCCTSLAPGCVRWARHRHTLVRRRSR